MRANAKALDPKIVHGSRAINKIPYILRILILFLVNFKLDHEFCLLDLFFG